MEKAWTLVGATAAKVKRDDRRSFMILCVRIFYGVSCGKTAVAGVAQEEAKSIEGECR